MLRQTLAATAATAALVSAGAAQAGTHWSIGISLPPAAVYVADTPRYVVQPAPVYYAPPPVVYAPVPRYVEREVYYAPPRVVYETGYHERRWEGRDDRWQAHRWHERHERRERWGGDHDMGPYRR